MKSCFYCILNCRYLLYFFSLIAGWPCIFFVLGWLPHYQVNYILLLIVGLIFTLNLKATTLPRPFIVLLLTQILAWGVYSVIHIDTSYYTRIFLLVITFSLIGIQLRFIEKKEFIKVYNYWLLIQIVCGAIGLLLVLIGVLHPIFQFTEFDGRPGYFFGLFTTNTYLGGLVRNAGFFDEPGALAFWGMYALLFNKLFVKNIKVEWILMIGLLSTLSLAYYIQLSLYLLFFYKKEFRKIFVICIILFVAMKGIASYNPAMNNAIFGRLQYNTETGTLQGDNRSVLMKRSWDIFLTSPIVGVGASKLASVETAKQYGFVGANFFFNWACDGIVGLLITYLPLIYLFKLGRYKPIYQNAGWIILVGCLQRPYDSSQLLYPLLNFTMILYAYYDLFLSSFSLNILDERK